MTFSKVALDQLACKSVINQLKKTFPAKIYKIEFTDNTNPVEAVEVDDILYLPSLHLQVWQNHIVPYEANADEDAFSTIIISIKENYFSSRHYVRSENTVTINDSVCIISNIFAHNFFHFIEELYKVIILERLGFDGKYVLSTMPSRLAECLPNFTLEFLTMLGVKSERILYCNQPTIFRKAWFTTHICHAEILLYRAVFFELREILINHKSTDYDGRGARIWVERKKSRRLINSDVIHECLRNHGFTIVDMAGLTVPEQISIIKQSEVLGGVHGAALIHSMFLKERSTVIECFSPDYVNPCILEVCQILRHKYLQVVPTNTSLRPYRDALDLNLDQNLLETILQGI